MQSAETQTSSDQPLPIIRAEGVNASERYLKRLCDHSFLSLWSYSCVFRNQGRVGQKGDGKEICDLLVVFGNHVLIFSDKYCEFKDTGDLQTNWERWYRAAVLNGAKQVWGAERWIKSYPDNVFVNKDCTQPFPINLPNPATAQYYRIVVAHGAAKRCRQHFGGNGSLIIVGSKTNPIHANAIAGKVPFTIGQTKPDKGFVHIFDDTTLDIVLQTLNTANDFIAYLTKKEQFFSSLCFYSAAGEENALAEYLKHRNAQGEHDFVYPANGETASYLEGQWEHFRSSSWRLAQIEADKPSYLWDSLIEEFSNQSLEGVLEATNCTLQEMEPGLRLMAAENRLRRRMLAEAFREILVDVSYKQPLSRIFLTTELNNICYVFLSVPRYKNRTDAENHVIRRRNLARSMLAVKIKYPDVQDIIGIVKQGRPDFNGLTNLTYLDVKEWTEEKQAKAIEMLNGVNLLENADLCLVTAQEYPNVSKLSQSNHSTRKPRPNKPCTCGSTVKYKHCFGK